MPKRGSERARYAQDQEIASQAGAHLKSARMKAPPDAGAQAMRDFSEGRITWEEAERRFIEHRERSQRAAEAQRTGRRARDPRDAYPAPEESRQWAKPMSTRPFRDPQLTPLARSALAVIVAEMGYRTRRILNNAYLAARLHVSRRWVQHLVGQLARRGYLTIETVYSEMTGLAIGRRIRICDELVRPFWHGSLREQAESSTALNRQEKRAGAKNAAQPATNDASPTKPTGFKAKSSTSVEDDELKAALNRLASHFREKPG
jgi:hypothetical protein